MPFGSCLKTPPFLTWPSSISLRPAASLSASASTTLSPSTSRSALPGSGQAPHFLGAAGGKYLHGDRLVGKKDGPRRLDDSDVGDALDEECRLRRLGGEHEQRALVPLGLLQPCPRLRLVRPRRGRYIAGRGAARRQRCRRRRSGPRLRARAAWSGTRRTPCISLSLSTRKVSDG